MIQTGKTVVRTFYARSLFSTTFWNYFPCKYIYKYILSKVIYTNHQTSNPNAVLYYNPFQDIFFWEKLIIIYLYCIEIHFDFRNTRGKKFTFSAVVSRALQAVQKDDGAVNSINPTDLNNITVNHSEAH